MSSPARMAPRPLSVTVADYLRILRKDPGMSNEALFAAAGRKSTDAAAEARKQIRAEWSRAASRPAPVLTVAPEPAPRTPTAEGDVQAALDLLHAALTANGKRLVSVTVEETTTTTLPYGSRG